MDEKGQEMETVAEDKETIDEARDSLEHGGTSEGGDEVDGHIERAEEVTVEVFEGHDQELEGKQQESQEFQSELEDRKQTDESDLGKLSDASGRIETQETVNEVRPAKEAALKDIEILSDQKEQSNQDAERSEQLQKDQQARVYSGRRS
jgi:hypothetical protein